MKEKPWLVETFLDEWNIFASGKFSWWSKNIGLWKKTSLIKENPLLVENLLDEGKLLACDKFLDEEKISICAKPPWWSKNIGLLKSFIYCGKTIALSLLEMKSSNETNMLVLKPLRYLFLNKEQKPNSLIFLR